MIWQTNIEEEFEEEEILEGVLEGVQAFKSVKSLLSNSYVFWHNVYSTFFLFYWVVYLIIDWWFFMYHGHKVFIKYFICKFSQSVANFFIFLIAQKLI